MPERMDVRTYNTEPLIQFSEMLRNGIISVFVPRYLVYVWLQFGKIRNRPRRTLRLCRRDLTGFLVHGLVYADQTLAPIDIFFKIQSEELADPQAGATHKEEYGFHRLNVQIVVICDRIKIVIPDRVLLVEFERAVMPFTVTGNFHGIERIEQDLTERNGFAQTCVQNERDLPARVTALD